MPGVTTLPGHPHDLPEFQDAARFPPDDISRGSKGFCAQRPEGPGTDPRAPTSEGRAGVIPDEDRASNGIRPASGGRCLAAPDLTFIRDANEPRRFAL